jgi:mannose-6-phosphate isomerase-like protein (cupin superfamily)
MNVIRWNDLEFVPASHEDANDPGVVKKVLFTAGLMQAGQPQMINWARLKVGRSFRAHYHEDMYEIFVVMTGACVFRLMVSADEAGDAVFVPERDVHEMEYW